MSLPAEISNLPDELAFPAGSFANQAVDDPVMAPPSSWFPQGRRSVCFYDSHASESSFVWVRLLCTREEKSARTQNRKQSWRLRVVQNGSLTWINYTGYFHVTRLCLGRWSRVVHVVLVALELIR